MSSVGWNILILHLTSPKVGSSPNKHWRHKAQNKVHSNSRSLNWSFKLRRHHLSINKPKSLSHQNSRKLKGKGLKRGRNFGDLCKSNTLECLLCNGLIDGYPNPFYKLKATTKDKPQYGFQSAIFFHIKGLQPLLKQPLKSRSHQMKPWSFLHTKTCQENLASKEIYNTESNHSITSKVATSSSYASTFTSNSSTTPLDSKTWICLWRQEAHTSHQVLDPNPLLV